MNIDDDLYARMVEGLQIAATTFRKYEKLHRAKGTAESYEKARVNQEHAQMLEALGIEALEAIAKG